ncbi:MAG: ABC-2 transporter permease [Corallococcus sp.]|nr:ABC-2 transporter permease [Corallococcus sp.]MCM1359843.1 ABC-2 transporter permease [Corallococcus sp.]MCM1395277.1 ABC-2 transporter permease [Corallococcus sp.]
MIKLYLKELKLNVKLPVWLIGLLGAMVLIPNYPIIVGIGYSIFQIFIYMQYARENRSQEFSAMLPVKRNDIVSSTVSVIVTLEAVNLLVSAISGAAVRICYGFGVPAYAQGNIVGLDANLTFFGVALICLAIFNLIFITQFFKSGYKYGVPIVTGLLTFVAVYAILELMIQLVPVLKNSLDTFDVETVWARLIVLTTGMIAYVGSAFAADKIAQKNFEKVSL